MEILLEFKQCIYYIVDTKYPSFTDPNLQIQLSTEFALHGLLYLAAHKGNHPVQLAEIASATKVKESYLRKLFLQLVRAGLLNAYKGSSGGYSLRKNPDQISFYDIVEAMEGVSGTFRCYADYRSCEIHPSCPIIQGFGEAFEVFFQHLKQITLADILSHEKVKNTTATWLLQPMSEGSLTGPELSA